VLVTDDGHVKLLDFGIAKLLEDEAAAAAATQLTRQGERALTLAFAAPEQVTGNAITTATDVYALGVLLHMLLTGKHPAQSSLHSPVELAKAIVESESPRISEVVAPADKLRRAFRGDLEAIVGKALSKNPAERYASVTALAEDLRRYLTHYPISARPNTVAYRTKNFVRRNRLAVALASAAIVASGAGLVGTIIQARRAASAAERERSAAERARVEATTATTVKDFLLGIFNASSKRQPDPMRAQAVTARELLDRGAERLLADSTLEPKVAFELLSALVGLYRDLDLHEKVIELSEKRIEAARVAFAPNDPRLASALVDYARAAFYSTAKAKDSLAFLEEAERILDSNGDQTSLIRVSTDVRLAWYWGGPGRNLNKLRSYARQAVEICRRNHPKSPLFIESLRMAAEAERWARDARAAFELLKEAVELHRRLGAPEFDLISPLVELAMEEQSLSRFADAERHYKEAVALSLRLNGEEHSFSIHTVVRYGGFLDVVGRLRESEALLRKALQTAVRLLGPEESLRVPLARHMLAVTLSDAGKIEEAELLFRRVMAVREKTQPNTLYHANVLDSAALLQLLLGRYELADRMFAQAQLIWEHLGQADTAWSALRRAQYELAVGEPSRALSTLATTTFTHEYGSFSADVIRARALLELGRAEEAERLASASLERFSTTPEAEELRLNKAEVLVAHGLALTRLGRAKEAEAPLRDALAWREANMDENSPMVAESLIAMAECYLSQGERAKARPLIERAKRIHRSHANLGEHLRAPLRKIERRLAAR
jgi:serine/threonine-protein kinase